LLLARTDTVVVAAGRIAVYPEGFEFTVWVVGRPGEELAHFDLPLAWAGRPRRAKSGEVPPEIFRFGIQFSDGSKATTLEAHRYIGRPPEQPPSGPVLWGRHGGSRGANSSEQVYWVWPLPPEGPLAFVCEWPANNIPLTRVEIDAGVILQAATRVEELWPEAQR
jgi:hypothetical protein